LVPHIKYRYPLPALWRTPFSSRVQHNLHTVENPTGLLTNSDLDLAAALIGATLIVTNPLTPRDPHILLTTDNTPCLSWLNKGSTTSNAAPSYLLHLLSHLHCATPYCLFCMFTPGITNTLADCCSRFFHLSDSDFLTIWWTNASPYSRHGHLSPHPQSYSTTWIQPYSTSYHLRNQYKTTQIWRHHVGHLAGLLPLHLHQSIPNQHRRPHTHHATLCPQI
jgi:hypothetical protein